MTSNAEISREFFATSYVFHATATDTKHQCDFENHKTAVKNPMVICLGCYKSRKPIHTIAFYIKSCIISSYDA